MREGIVQISTGVPPKHHQNSVSSDERRRARLRHELRDEQVLGAGYRAACSPHLCFTQTRSSLSHTDPRGSPPPSSATPSAPPASGVAARSVSASASSPPCVAAEPAAASGQRFWLRRRLEDYLASEALSLPSPPSPPLLRSRRRPGDPSGRWASPSRRCRQSRPSLWKKRRFTPA